MQYFNNDFIQFFKELSQNNKKEWFHSQKKRYEQSVKNPFTQFINDLILAIQKEDDSINIEAKDCILRINKDIRFSKDKSPYNLHYSAVISQAGRKDKSIPGIFMRFTPEMVGIMGGCYGVDKDQLKNIRTAIDQNPKAFRSLIEAKGFKEKFGSIRGEAIKRIPKDLQAAVEKEPLIANKQFYYMAEREAKLILSENLIDELMDYWNTMRPVNEYLNRAMVG